MTNEIITTTKEKEYSLPQQVKMHFPNADEEQIEMIKLCYSGNKKNPSFQEWLESYQQNIFLKHSNGATTRGARIETALIAQSKKITLLEEDSNVDKETLKTANRELKRLQNLLNYNDGVWLEVNKELNKLVQNTLSRETSKKVEVTNIKVTPADVAQLLHEANAEAIDVDSEEIK